MIILYRSLLSLQNYFKKDILLSLYQFGLYLFTILNGFMNIKILFKVNRGYSATREIRGGNSASFTRITPL